MADIEAEDMFGEHLSLCIGTENSNWNPDGVPGFAAFAHKLSVGEKVMLIDVRDKCQVPSSTPSSTPR
jgi:hypothetical protein